MYELISLNIQGSKILQFYIDGPALRLRRQGEATRWFPLRRIRQICITGELANGAETLVKLAEKRIPITLFSASGKLLCQMIHPDSAPAELTQLLDEVSHDVALADAYQQWTKTPACKPTLMWASAVAVPSWLMKFSPRNWGKSSIAIS